MNLYWVVAREEYSNVNEIESSYSQFTDEMRRRGIEFSFIALEDCIVTTHPEKGICLTYQSQMLDESGSAFIISQANLNAQARSVASTLRLYLRARGARLLNESIAGIETLEWNKVAQMTLATIAGAPVLPFTMLGYHRHIVPAIQKFADNYPGEYIFKPTGTGMGFGIIKSDSRQHAVGTGNLISSSAIEYVMLPYIEKAQDIRFFFIDNALVFIKFRIPRGNGYIGNVALGGEQVTLSEEEFNEKYAKQPFFQEMRELSFGIVKKSGCSVLAVDWLMNEHEYYFNEMSTAETGMTTLPEAIRTRVFNHLANIVHYYE
ncbi:TPA: RimK family alpha-L-glutamate ligase [Salmonella enterica]